MSSPQPSPEAQSEDQQVDQLDERWIRMIDTALRLQAPAAASYVRRLREKKPHATDDELIEDVCRKFTALMTATGAGIGGAAALPGIGTAAAVGLTVGEGASFAEACAFLTLAVAAIRGVDMKNADTRRIVMLGVLGGDKGTEIIAKALGKQGLQWNTVLAGGGTSIVPRLIHTQVSRWIKRKVVARAGTLWLGRLLPFGIGAVIGGVGNRTIARSVTEAVREIFAQAPTVPGQVVAPEGDGV